MTIISNETLTNEIQIAQKQLSKIQSEHTTYTKNLDKIALHTI